MNFDLYIVYFSILLISGTIVIVSNWFAKENFPVLHQTSEDEGAPLVLYLRSFNVDGDHLESGNFGDPGIKFIYKELLIAETLIRYARIITVGKPGELNRETGFDRRYFSNEDWKENVSRMIKESSLIIFRPDSSDAVLWEYQRIVDFDFKGKTIIWRDMGFANDVALQKVRYKVFCDKVAANVNKILPPFDRYKSFLSYSKSAGWVPYTYIKETPSYISLLTTAKEIKTFN